MPSNLRTRTRDFALRIIKLSSVLPTRGAGSVLGLQLLRAGTSVGAHYREACRAKSNADFISKIEGALQELEETIYWLELISNAGIIPAKRLEALCAEAEQLMAILVTVVKNVKTKNRPAKSNRGY